MRLLANCYTPFTFTFTFNISIYDHCVEDIALVSNFLVSGGIIKIQPITIVKTTDTADVMFLFIRGYDDDIA